MPGPKPCLPGCDCGHHNLPKQPREEYLRKQREAQRARRAASPELRERERRRSAERRGRDPSVRGRQRTQDLERAPLRRLLRYGLTPERFLLLVEEQDGRCYLCNEPLDLDTPRKAHIDHDHSCCRGSKTCGDCVRGIACAGCNKAIARYGDSPERLEQAAAALRAANARVAERLAARDAQGELPLNVVPIEREAKGA